MHDNDQHPADLDEAIDATARGLTDGGPRPALRATVAKQIAARHGLQWRAAWPVVVAAAAVLVAAVLLWPPSSIDAPVGRTLLRSPGEPDKARPTSEIVLSEPDKVRPTEEEVKTVTGVATTEPTIGPEPIVVESLEMMPLDMSEIDMPLLSVEALTIEPLQVQ